MIFRSKILLSLLHFLCGLLILSFLGCTKNNSQLKNIVVVRVNDEVLSAGKFSDLLMNRLKEFNVLSAKDSAVITQAKNAVISDFIIKVVTEEWAKKNQVFVHKEEFDKELNQIRKNYPDDNAFRKSLAEQDLTYDLWEENLNFTLLERLVSANLRSKLKDIPADDLKNYYLKNKAAFQKPAAIHLRQILTDSNERAADIKKELTGGKSFSDLAKNYSLSVEAANGGDMGWIEKGSSEMIDTNFRLAEKQRSNVIKSSYGYHIFEVIQKRAAKNLTYEEARPQIQKILLAQLDQIAYSKWLEQQILSAHIFKNEEYINKVQVQSRGQK